MSPERSSSPLSPQAVAPRMIAMEVESDNVREADSPSHQVAENGIQVAGESNGSTVPVTNDDDLTSLTWLQDRNLLKGMNLSKNETDESYNVKNENGNGVTQTTQPLKENHNNNHQQQQQQLLQQQQQDYAIPDLSPTSDYVDESSTSAADSSSSSLNSPVPYTNNFTPRNKHPHNVPYDPKIHTTSKPPYSFSCLIFMAIENSEQKALPVKEIYAWILEHFPYFKNAPTGWKNSVRHNLSLNKCFQKVEKAPNLGKGSLWMVDQQYRPNLLQALNRSPFHPCTPLDPGTYLTPKTSHINEAHKQSHHRLPDPELFPYLSRRLAASEAKHETTSDDSLDDMDAANVMLALKHGPRILKERRRRSVKMNSPLDLVQVITTSPSEDHTYSAAKSHDNASPDEAFESDDESANSKKYDYLSIDLEEQRKIEEGADALLNLAGISTLRKRTYSNSNGNSNSNVNVHVYDNSNNSNSNNMENSVNVNIIKRKRPHHHHSNSNSNSNSNNNHHHQRQQLQLELVTSAAIAVAEDDEYEKPSQFRPRLLRVKRKIDNQKRKVLNHNHNHNHINNNNNNINNNNNLMKNDWVRHRKAIEESTTANTR